MALTGFQRDVCRLLAERRIASGESYVAGGATLNELTAGTRISRDVDLFHDTRAALDWVDIIHCDETVQPVGCLAWAACGKDPGFSPAAILEHAARTARYTHAEVEALEFEGVPPRLADLSVQWHEILERGRAIVEMLPAEYAGSCVLTSDGIFRGEPGDLRAALSDGVIRFRQGSIRGAFPRIIS